ncbi:MAG TPA: 2,3-bisphosphoglycerate-independent phosphoglycerate mutase [bacterium]|nr:2,3-bisphosphoglycerate-independent phosphoglycerate mutase [bacterium]
MNEDNNIEESRLKPVVLVILDGWGVAPALISNAIAQAKTPNFNKYVQQYFSTTLQASGEAVGLPFGEMGNSEVGHLNIGAGKIIFQELPRINRAILNGEFFKNSILIKACLNAKKNKTSLHIIGLISTGGVHASVDHLYALLELAKQQQLKDVFVHAILDGRDMGYNSGLELLRQVEKKMQEIGVGKIATVCGRFWAMDRDNHWERISPAYQAMTYGIAESRGIDVLIMIQKSYTGEIYDEELKPIVCLDVTGQPLTTIKDKDAVIFLNFRADRARELTRAFVLPGFEKFERPEYLANLYFVTMTQYEKQLPVDVAFPPEHIIMPLAKVLSEQGLKQLHIAETEKYAHVTYFFNGGLEETLPGEERVLIPSPRVESYAEKPEMSAGEIKNTLVKEISNNKFDFIVVNFANSDMVSHTGDQKATIKAIEKVDKYVGEIVDAVLNNGGVTLITADHGNAECLVNDKTGEIDKEHSTAPVPFLIIGQAFKSHYTGEETVDLTLLTPSGVLADIAPTILKIMQIEQPKEMTGRSLI